MKVKMMTAESAAMVFVRTFIYLQLLDLLTTLVGYKLGVGEASPFIRSLFHLGPYVAVAASKFVAVVLAGCCIALGRAHLVRWINYWYATLVVWNLCNILAA